jgi:hypothetical protein
VRDHGNDLARILKLREAELRDRAVGPWLSVSGAVIDGYPPSSATALVLRDEHEVHKFVPTLIAENVDFLSVQIQLGEKAWREVLAQAHPAEGKHLQVVGAQAARGDARRADRERAGRDAVPRRAPARGQGVGSRWIRPSWIQSSSASRRPACASRPLLRGTARMTETPTADAPELKQLSNQYSGLWMRDLEVRSKLEANFSEVAKRVLAVQRASSRAWTRPA